MSSEIAQLREGQRLQEEAARNGLYGLASVANHEAINKRMTQNASRLLKLFRSGREEEARVIMENGWNIDVTL